MHRDISFEAFEPFFSDGLISEVLYLVKTGKEAALYCCRGGAKLGDRLVAAKVYKPRAGRAFRNDSAYFPQAIDPRFNSRAYELLRDLDHVCRFFARFSVESDPGGLTAHLWDRFTRGALT